MSLMDSLGIFTVILHSAGSQTPARADGQALPFVRCPSHVDTTGIASLLSARRSELAPASHRHPHGNLRRMGSRKNINQPTCGGPWPVFERSDIGRSFRDVRVAHNQSPLPQPASAPPRHVFEPTRLQRGRFPSRR